MIRKIKTFMKLLVCGLKSITCVYNAEFYTAEETVNIIVKNRVSIIRWGDGEFNILNGTSVSYQPWSIQLQKEMKQVIVDYIEGNSSYLLCMPGEFLLPKAYQMNKTHLKSWIFSRYYFKKHYDVNIKYGDAFLFAKGNEYLYSKIWKNCEIDKVVFVHNNSLYADDFVDTYKIKTIFIKIPDKDAFSKIQEIEDSLINEATYKSLILISAGPAAKVIVKDLCSIGLWCIDTGHCWDSPLLLRK